MAMAIYLFLFLIIERNSAISETCFMPICFQFSIGCIDEIKK